MKVLGYAARYMTAEVVTYKNEIYLSPSSTRASYNITMEYIHYLFATVKVLEFRAFNSIQYKGVK